MHIAATHLRLELADPQAPRDATHKHNTVRAGLNARPARAGRRAVVIPIGWAVLAIAARVVSRVVRSTAHASSLAEAAIPGRRASVLLALVIPFSPLLAVTQLRLRLADRLATAVAFVAVLAATLATPLSTLATLVVVISVFFVAVIALVGRVVRAITTRTPSTHATSPTRTVGATHAPTAPASVSTLTALLVHPLFKVIVILFLALEPNIPSCLPLHLSQFAQHRDSVQLLIL
jgi:hypothetical protein